MWLMMLKDNQARILRTIAQKAPNHLEELRVVDIAEATGVCPATVRNHIKMLVASGYITVWRDDTTSPY